MAYKVIPADFSARLTRIKAELARRNGYGDLSSYSTMTYPAGTPIAAGGLITTPVFNTLRTGLTYINGTGLPGAAVANETYINSADLDAIDAALTVFEAQPRGALSNNDCSALCSGMCVSQCTTSCLSTCTGGCADACSATCTGTCTVVCGGNCTGTCTGDCTSTCTGGCTGNCWVLCGTDCGGSCSGGCYTGCNTTCKTACRLGSMY